ncbi:blue-light-activated protein [mine drainage metagenome]|uniref:Blue-light-activated protein n=1 Tax=mine drainage metagenome TaxID=410659 RepID=A0A1J5SUL5_9ZZZZ
MLVPDPSDALRPSGTNPDSGSDPLAELWRRCALDSPNGLLVGRLDSGRATVVLSCNQAFERLTGHARVEAAGRSPAELLQADSSREEWARLELKLADGRPFDSIVEARRADGRIFLCHAHGYPLFDDSCGLEHWVLALADVTTAAGRIRREFENLDGLGTLAGGVAHDFNNLLAIILGYASLLRQVAADNARVVEYCGIISDAATRGAEVVRQLMVFANQNEPVPVETDVHALLADVLVRTAPEWPERIRLDYDFSAAQSRVPVDPEQIGNALEHLLRNARESIADSGSVIVRTRDRGILRDHNPALEWLEIEVEDDGCGMDEATRARMFEPFFARNKSAEVRGIGLALVYGIMRAHRGHIEVHSEPLRGTRISLLLPRGRQAVRNQREPIVAENYQLESSVGILLVEDETDLARLWTGLAARQGWELIWASSAEEALAQYQSNAERIHLVFSDVGLPGEMDGWELCARLRALRPELPLLLASGYFKQNTIDQLNLAEPIAFIQKPYLLNEAIEAINGLIKRIP